MTNKGNVHHDVWAAFALLRRVTRPATAVFDGLERAEKPLGRSPIADHLITPPDPREVLAGLLRTDGGGRAAPLARRGSSPADTLPQPRSKPTILPDPKSSAPIAKPFLKSDPRSVQADETHSSDSAKPASTRRSLTAVDYKPMSLKQVAQTRLSRRRASLKQSSDDNAPGAIALRDQTEKIIPLSKKVAASSAKLPSRPERHPLEQLAARSNRTRTFAAPGTSNEDAASLEVGSLSHIAKGKGADGIAPEKVTKTTTAPDLIKKARAPNERPKPALLDMASAHTSVPVKPSKLQMRATAPDRLKSTSPRLGDEQQALEEEAWRNGAFER